MCSFYHTLLDWLSIKRSTGNLGKLVFSYHPILCPPLNFDLKDDGGNGFWKDIWIPKRIKGKINVIISNNLAGVVKMNMARSLSAVCSLLSQWGRHFDCAFFKMYPKPKNPAASDWLFVISSSIFVILFPFRLWSPSYNSPTREKMLRFVNFQVFWYSCYKNDFPISN